ncbi:unnamed protein product [Dracunculus medinensis]|uniref:GOLD domain-containing protein n=1 Tax=Dracunculus medinensis TaxID=318479 RepID=A0A0N4U7X6_DRAME|nr:unnamed protein product [Dracunculus medinensis]
MTLSLCDIALEQRMSIRQFLKRISFNESIFQVMHCVKYNAVSISSMWRIFASVILLTLFVMLASKKYDQIFVTISDWKTRFIKDDQINISDKWIIFSGTLDKLTKTTILETTKFSIESTDSNEFISRDKDYDQMVYYYI